MEYAINAIDCTMRKTLLKADYVFQTFVHIPKKKLFTVKEKSSADLFSNMFNYVII